ncbi:MAG: VOC family protein [Chloroflexota bacterium]|nr:VOC family protein [Chloroflexota bacterium]
MTAPLANAFTLGTRDFARMRAFYRSLGWPIVFDSDDFAAFELRGAVLCLYPIDKLAVDGRVQPERERGGMRFTIGIIADTRDDVDTLTEVVRVAGARITKEPVDSDLFEGRSAYWADPEDNYWEIVWAPPGNAPIDAARRAARA